MLTRTPRNLEDDWHKNMMILYISDHSTFQSLTPSSPTPSSPTSPFHYQWNFNFHWNVASRHRSLGFSPQGGYIADHIHAFIWSTESHELVAYFRVQEFTAWMLNTGEGFNPIRARNLILLCIMSRGLSTLNQRTWMVSNILVRASKRMRVG